MKKILMMSLMIMIAAVGIFFTACGYTKKDVLVNASYSGMENGYLSLVVGQEARVEFTVTKLPKNASARLIFSKNSSSITTPVLESYQESTGKSVVTFTAISKGEEIYLRAIADGGNFYELHIKISLPITDFTLKSDAQLFAVRGQNNPQTLKLDSSIFNFYPSDTSQKEIIFQDSNGNELTQINANDYPNVGEISIRASSPYISKFNDLKITLIDEIGVVDTFEKGDIQDKKLISKEQATLENPQTNILFVTNRSNLSRKTIRVIVSDNDSSLLRITRKVFSQTLLQCSDFDISKTYKENGSTIFEFELQSLQEGATTIIFDVYYYGYESYKITRTLEAVIKNAPDQIRMNDIKQESNITQILFDGAYSTVYSTQYLSIIPSTAIYDKIEVSYDLGELVSVENPNPVIGDYISFTIGASPIGSQITNLSSPIVAKGIKATDSKIIYLVIQVFWGEEYALEHGEDPVEYRLGFEVKTGATALLLKEQYNNTDGIYLEQGSEKQTFLGLFVEKSQSYTDNISVYPITQAAGLYAKIDANQEPNQDGNGKILPLEITPLSTGSGKWRVMLPNGIYRDITIHVVPKVQSLKLDFNEYNSSRTSVREYSNNSLTKLGVKLTKTDSVYTGFVELKFIINPSNYNFGNTKLYQFDRAAATVNGATIQFNSSTNILSVSTTINGFSEKAFDYMLIVKKVKDFKLISLADLTPNTPEYEEFETNNIFSGALVIEAYVPLTRVAFAQSEVSLYSYSQLGLNFKELSETNIGLVYSPNELTPLFEDILPSLPSKNIKIDLSASISYEVSGNTIFIANYGNYNFETQTLTVDVQSSIYDTFYIYARITYFNEIFTASLKVTPKFYQTVNEVYLSNSLPVDTNTKQPYIYLSPTHSYQDIFTYISPQNAVHKDLRYTFEPDLSYSGSLVKIEPNSNDGVRILYNNEYANIGLGGWGTLYISPLASIMDTSSYPDNSLKIRVRIGAGSEENPFIISTAQELINIGTSGYDKFYEITNIIDLSNIHFTSLGFFSGTIDGKGKGKIIGLNITKQVLVEENNVTMAYSGLFTKLQNQGTIKNLIIEGSINLTADRSGSIGLVAGELEQGASLQNVTVFLNQSTVSIATKNELRVGGVVGVNRGTIQNNIGINPNSTNEELYVNYPSIVMNAKFTMSYTLQVLQSRSYFGGIAGVNEGNGIIKRFTQSKVKVYNNDNYAAVVNMVVEGAKSIQTSAEQLNFSIGALLGKNAAKVTAENASGSLDVINYYDYIKANGKIEIVQANNRLGGLIGDNLGQYALLENAVSRVKLKSSGTGKTNARLGGLFAYNQDGQILNSLIQALEDGISLGTASSMIYSAVFGITQGENPVLDGKVNIYGFDNNMGAIQNAPASGTFSSLKAQTYVGAVPESGNMPEGKRALVSTTEFGTFNNYYGDFLVGTIGLMFAPVDATLIGNPDNTVNKMTSTTSNLNMAYLQLFQSLNTNDQTLLSEFDEYDNNYEFPFDFNGEINLYSFDTNILTIGSDGKLTVRSSGMVKVRVSSALNAKISQDVMIYVIKAANHFSLYIQNISEENEINHGKVIEVFSGKTVPLVVQFYFEPIKLGGKNIEFEVAEGYSIYNNYIYDEDFVKTIELIQIGSLYGLEAINGKGNTTFKIYSNIQLMVQGNQFTSTNLKNSLGTETQYEFIVSHISGVTSIQTNLDHIAIEPTDVFNANFLTYTDDFDDEIIITQTKQNGSSVESGNYFEVRETNRIYTLKLSGEFPQELSGEFTLEITQINTATGAESKQDIALFGDIVNGQIKLANGNFASVISLDMSNYFTIVAGSYRYQFNIRLSDTADGEMLAGTTINSYISLLSIQTFYSGTFQNVENANYSGTYYVNANASSNTEIVSTITIDVRKQAVNEIIADSFFGSTKDDINSGKEQFNFIDPQTKNPNHMRISVYPYFADYDYVEIINETPSVTTLFTLIDENGENKYGAFLVSNGIKVLKESIQNDYLYIKYASSSIGVVNGQTLTYSIKAYKNNQVVYTTYKNITVRFTKDVTFEIEGRPVVNEETTIYLTRGSTYNFSVASNGYLENEIYMSTTREDIISINKAGRTIQVLTNFTYQTTTRVSISIQGRKVVGGNTISSTEYTLVNIIIVDYYILPTNGFSIIGQNSEISIPTDSYTPIKGGSNGIVSIGLGNTYKIETEFLKGLNVEYSSNVSGIATSLSTFQNLLNSGAIWQYQIGSSNADGSYSYVSWNSVPALNASVDKNTSNGNFTLTKTASGYVFTPLKVTSITNPTYIFRLTFGYEYENGLAVMSQTQNVRSFEFVFNVYQLSSIDTPTPIYSSQEFSNMNAGAYYILMENITLPSIFSPITNEIAGLDGNGKKITIANNISVDSSYSRVGIFSTIAKGALIRNLTIEIATTSRLTINQATQSSVYVGLLAGENKGVVTNVNITTVGGSSFRVAFATEITQQNNYVAGLIGLNSGYVTNSRVIINLTSSANLSGFVAYNTGKISSSYVDKSLIINTSNELQNKTAGFVIYNAMATANGGKIINSYISGLHTGSLVVPMYANDTSTVLRSSTEVAGFVYENNGIISNAYSDTPIQTSSKSAGFVYLNKGTISNTYSTSQLKSSSQESYGYVYSNTGVLTNNFYLKDVDVNFSINTSYDNISASMLKPLTKLQFNLASNFENFLFTSSTEITKGDWFMPMLTSEGQYNNISRTFTVGKPELVSANLVAKASLVVDLERTIKDDVTGEVTYYYKNSSPYAQGSIYNPYLISTALELENTIKNSSSGNLNNNNFRIIADIDYEELVITSSKLFNTIIIGDIEGNGMEIRGYIIDSSVSTSSSGFFSKIGNGTSDQGSVKNLTLKPKYINMPNSNIVGGLAGTLDSGIIFNINMNGFGYSNSGIVILGKNMVGGVIGRAIGSYRMTNIESSISTNATYRSPFVLGQSSAENKITSYFLFRSHVVNTLSKLSYSGTVVAVAAGTGQITNVTVNGLIASMAEFASLAFGGVGDGVTIQKVQVSIVQGQFVQPAVYGGIVAGEFYGRMSNVTVSSANEVTNIFKVIPFKPYAVGGLVGLMGSSSNLSSGSEGKLGGRIENAKVTLSIKSTSIKIVGGLVGELIGGRIANGVVGIVNYDDFVTSIKSVSFVGSLQSEEVAGGMVGQISSKPSAQISYANVGFNQGFIGNNSNYGFTVVDGASVTGGTITVTNENNGYASVGGIVGKTTFAENSSSIFKIKNTYSTNKIKITSDIFGSLFKVYAGGLVGGIIAENNSTSTLQITNSYFASSIVLSLRDLKQLPGINSSIYYGKIVANNPSQVVSGQNVFYQDNETTYTGMVSESSLNDYLLLKYLENGTMKEFNNSTASEKQFHQTTLKDVNVEANNEKGLPSSPSGFGFDFVNIWVIKVAGQWPVLRFE